MLKSLGQSVGPDLYTTYTERVIRQIDGAASIDTGLELAGVAGLVRRAGSIYNLHRKGDPAGECRPLSDA